MLDFGVYNFFSDHCITINSVIQPYIGLYFLTVLCRKIDFALDL